MPEEALVAVVGKRTILGIAGTRIPLKCEASGSMEQLTTTRGRGTLRSGGAGPVKGSPEPHRDGADIGAQHIVREGSSRRLGGKTFIPGDNGQGKLLQWDPT